MTATDGASTAPGRGLIIALLVVATLAAAAVGAYFDWLWWHPTQGIIVLEALNIVEQFPLES